MCRALPSITSFFRSVTVILQEKDQRKRLVSNVLQDMLRVLTLWFDYGGLPEVAEAMKQGFKQINIDIWLYVIPQLIARIHTPVERIRKLLHRLLCHVGRRHPQALIYSLTVASNASSEPRQVAATRILNDMRRIYPTLVDQAVLVSRELIRIAILWHEQWHEWKYQWHHKRGRRSRSQQSPWHPDAKLTWNESWLDFRE